MKLLELVAIAVALLLHTLWLEKNESRIVVLETRVAPADPRVKELEFRVDELESLLRALTWQPDTYKPKDAPPLRWVPAGPGYRTLQYWTEKDGWQFIPKQTHP